MKIEIEIEIDRSPPKNYKWEFVRFGKAESGDYFVEDGKCGWWSNDHGSTNQYQIFKLTRTHHDSGIPIDLPDAEPPEGYIFGKMGWGEYFEGEYLYADKGYNKFHRNSGMTGVCDDTFYIELIKITQSTTLKDLVGEDGQKTFWLIAEDDSARTSPVCYVNGGLRFKNSCVTGIISMGLRWSHSPFTKYEDANEFML